jgi:hypothetical protein
MYKIKPILSFLLCVCVFYYTKAQVTNKEAGVCFRVDDTQPIDKLRMFDSLFRSKGLKFTFGCNAQIVERIGGEEYWKLLKDMQNYGHDIADHSPNHYSQFFEVTIMQDTLMYASKQGVDHINNVFYNPNANGPKICLEYNLLNSKGLGDEGKVTIIGNKLITQNNGEFSSSRIYGAQNITKFYLPSLDLVLGFSGISNVNPLDPDTATLMSFWNEDVNFINTDTIPFKMLSNFDIEVNKAGFLLMQQHTQYLFAKHGLKNPTTWIQPGGEQPYLSEGFIEETLGHEFSYHSGACYPTCVKTFNEYDPNGSRRFSMQWGDFYEENQSTSSIKNTIADRLARHHLSIGLNHFSFYGGLAWNDLLKNINELLDWCKAKSIKVETYDYWANELYSKIPNQNVNIAPSLNIDLDEDGLPDGFGNLNTFDSTTGVAQSGGKSFSGKNGQVITIQRLGGVEKGKNVIRLSTKGGTENDKVNIFINVQDKDINYYFDVPANTADFTEYSKEFWIPEDAFLISVYFNVYSSTEKTIYVSGLDIRGVSKPKIKFKKLTKKVNEDYPVIDLDKSVFDTAFAATSMKWSVLTDALSFAKLDTIHRKLNIITKPFWLGDDSIKLIAMNPLGQSDTCTLYFTSSSLSVCAGQLVELKAPFDTIFKYKWIAIPADTSLKNDTNPSIAVRPITTGVYKLSITQVNNIIQTFTIDVNIKPIRTLNTEMDTLIYNPLQDNIFELNKPFGYSFSILSQAKYNVELSNNVLKTIKGQINLGNDLVSIYVSNKTCDVGSIDIHILAKKSSLPNLELDKNLKVYPNPVSDYLRIEAPIGNTYELVLMDLNGQELKRNVIDQNSNGLCMMDIPKGFYILYLSNQIFSDRYYYKIIRN